MPEPEPRKLPPFPPNCPYLQEAAPGQHWFVIGTKPDADTIEKAIDLDGEIPPIWLALIAAVCEVYWRKEVWRLLSTPHEADFAERATFAFHHADAWHGIGDGS